jgi:hypothetical protein
VQRTYFFEPSNILQVVTYLALVGKGGGVSAKKQSVYLAQSALLTVKTIRHKKSVSPLFVSGNTL